MSLPKTCPHCDAGPGPFVNSYLCGTYLRAGHDAKKHQTKRCVTRELYAFADRARQLEARLAAIRNAGNALARHVAEDTRGQTARQLVQAWEEAAR